MKKENGFMKCSGCGAVWQGTWEASQEVTCPQCKSTLEPVQEEELQDM